MPKILTFMDEPERTYTVGRDEQVLVSSDIEYPTTMPDAKPAFRSNGLSSGNRFMIRSDIDTLADDEQEPPFDGSALDRLVAQWADVAVSHAVVRGIDDPPGLTAGVAGIDGAWGFGVSPEEALAELRSVLVDWARLKLEDGDDDIPSMEGVHLVVERCPQVDSRRGA